MNPGSRKRLRKADLFPLRADSPGRDRMGGLDRPGSSWQLSERGVIVSIVRLPILRGLFCLFSQFVYSLHKVERLGFAILPIEISGNF